jgi:hypothetical protein
MTRRLVNPPAAVATAAPRQVLPYDALGMDAESLKTGVLEHLQYTLAGIWGIVPVKVLTAARV